MKDLIPDKIKWPEKALANAVELDNQIENLYLEHWNHIEKNYSKFWEQAKIVSELFKKTKPLLHEDHERLWLKYSDICNEVKTKMEQDRAERKEKSDVLCKDLIDRIKVESEGYERCNDHLLLIQMRNNLDQLKKDLSNDTLLHEDKDTLWKLWRDIRTTVKLKLESIQDKNAKDILESLNQIRSLISENPYEALESIKTVQPALNEIFLLKETRLQLKKEIREIWDSIIEEIKAQHKEKKKRYLKWRSDMQEHLNRWTDIIDKNGGIISDLNRRISLLETELSQEKSPAQADIIRGWIKEKQDQIEAVNRTIIKLQAKIDSVTKRLQRNPDSDKSEHDYNEETNDSHSDDSVDNKEKNSE